MRQHQPQQPWCVTFEASAESRYSYYPSQHHSVRELMLVKVSLRLSVVGCSQKETITLSPFACRPDQQSAALAALAINSTSACRYGQASSTHCRCASTFPRTICEFRDSPTSHHPLPLSCINVDNTRHPFAGSMPRISSHRAAGPNFWNNPRDLSSIRA